jgi:HK97 family phage portal protein
VNWPWQREQRQSSLSEPNQDLIAALGGEQLVSGERINVDSALRITDVFAAVSIITETIATLPLRVYKRVGVDVIETPDHRAAAMLGQAPNPSQPAHRFWATLAGHLLLWGNAFVEKLRDQNGLVSELWLIHPGTVEVQWNEQLRQKRFVVRDQMGLQERVLTEDRVLHVFGFTVDGHVGLSPIQQTRQQLGLAKSRERFEGEVYGQKPFLSGVINHPGRVQDTLKLRDSWRAIYGGGDRGARMQSGRHSVAVLEEGATFQPLTAPLADMQFIEAIQASKTTIATIFHLPPAYLGGSIGDSLTYQTVEGNQIQFARQAITPITTNIQKFLGADRGVFPFSAWYPEFALEALLRGDSGARADYYTKMASIGAILPDEIRGLENMPPLPDGSGMTPAAAAVPTPALPAQGAAAAPNQGAVA